MFASKRELLAVVVLAALLYVEQLTASGHAPGLCLDQATRELNVQAHAWAGRARSWLVSFVPKLTCKSTGAALSIRCGIK